MRKESYYSLATSESLETSLSSIHRSMMQWLTRSRRRHGALVVGSFRPFIPSHPIPFPKNLPFLFLNLLAGLPSFF